MKIPKIEVEEPADFESTDPVDIILVFLKHIEGHRMRKSPMVINDRDRLLVTMILSLLADPSHHVGKLITRDIIKVWIDRGGHIPRPGQLARSMREPDNFEFAAQYLYDYGMPITEIAIVLGVHRDTVTRTLKYIKENDVDVKKVSTET